MVEPNVKMVGIYPKWLCRMLKWPGFIPNGRADDLKRGDLNRLPNCGIDQFAV